MRVLWIAVAVVFVDHLAKFAVLQNMYRGESIPLIGEWLKLTFTENPGMAFGITFGPPGVVTIFSILATLLIVYYIYRVRRGYIPYVASLAFILGGAIGNIIDRVFYGLFLGYGPLFSGKVVDFIHVDLWRGFIPQGVPFFGGSYVALFPIWNVADMAIVLGVMGILAFQRTFHERMVVLDQPTVAQEVPQGAPLPESEPRPQQSYVSSPLNPGLSEKPSSEV